MSSTARPEAPEVLRRWRLVLGRYAKDACSGASFGSGDERMERALDYLYGREYHGRGLRNRGKEGSRGGTLDPSQLSVPKWLDEVRKLFPQEVYEQVQGHALERYQLSEMLNDPKVLESLEPNLELTKCLLSFKGQLDGGIQAQVRRVIAKVVEELLRKLRHDFVNALVGRRNRFRRSNLKVAQNFDWQSTIRANLKNFDPERRALVVDRLHFHSRVKRQLPWDVVLCVDQSGSMLDSVIHSAVVAGILATMPSLRVKLVVFDTAIVDLSERCDDPVEVLMSVQLGGGTDIGRAMRYCEQRLENPARTILVLISDFEEGAPAGPLLATTRRLAESRVKLLGLAALDHDANPVYDRQMAERLASAGMEIAALTPRHFAQWLANAIS